MDIIYQDSDIVVCVKPPRVASTDIPGGLPNLLRQELGTKDFRTVHRLDQVVSGLMVVARNAAAASEISRQIRDDQFGKTYLAVVHGIPEESGTLRDLLLRNKAERKTYVVTETGKDVQEAILDYRVIASVEGFSKIHIQLRTGRTHQIRCQFSSRGYPLVGDRKYSTQPDECEIALWSHELRFRHPKSGEWMEFQKNPPCEYPWNLF